MPRHWQLISGKGVAIAATCHLPPAMPPVIIEITNAPGDVAVALPLCLIWHICPICILAIVILEMEMGMEKLGVFRQRAIHNNPQHSRHIELRPQSVLGNCYGAAFSLSSFRQANVQLIYINRHASCTLELSRDQNTHTSPDSHTHTHTLSHTHTRQSI